MLTELYARGFNYLSADAAGITRATRFLNTAMHDVDDAERWPYLAASSSGAAPLTIADLDGVERVYQNGSTLTASSRDVLLELYGDLTTTGTPTYFYLAAPTVVSVYPANTASISVTYWKFGPDLVSGSDAPLMPDRFREAIIERACAYAYRDNDDREMATVCMQESDRIVQRMREWAQLLPGETVQVLYGNSDDL